MKKIFSHESAKEVHSLLAKEYGDVTQLHRDSPTIAGDSVLDSLIATLLTQATNDRNALKAFQELKGKGRTWEEIHGMSGDELAEVIACGGLGRQKARYIQKILDNIRSEHPDYSLEALRETSPETVRAYLTALPGVGAKTAACVQAFALGQTAFPVDTHVARIMKRLGWAPARWTPTKIQNKMESTLDPAIQSDLHVYLINHGRRVCQAIRPRCNGCVLRKYCEHYTINYDKVSD
jgi:endonuclease-3